MLIAKDGKSEVSVFVRQGAGSTEKFAANELVRCIKGVSAATPILTSDRNTIRKNAIFIENENQNNQGFSIEAEDSVIRLKGNSEIGVLYAVYHFLEKYIGCIWPAPGVEFFPKKAVLEIGQLKEKQTPAMIYRGFMPPGKCNMEEYGQWTYRNRNNCVSPQSSQLSQEVSCLTDLNYFFAEFHSIRKWLPPERYFDKNPQYYALIKGKRTSSHVNRPDFSPQICFSQSESSKVIADNIKRFLKEFPHINIVAFGPSDGRGWCECDKCRAQYGENELVYKQPGFPKVSAAYLSFLNRIAESVANDYPQVKLVYLAYTSTAEPPSKIEIHPNILILYCTYWRCSSHAISDPSCEVNVPHHTMIKRWIDKGANVILYEYLYGMGAQCGMPFYLVNRLEQDWPHYSKIGVKGTTSSTLGEPYLLNCYVAARLAWDPNADVDKATKDFCQGYYNRAGDVMKEFFDLWGKAMKEYPSHIAPSPTSTKKLLSEKIIDEMLECLASAWNIEQGTAEGERINRMRDLMEYTRLYWLMQDQYDKRDFRECSKYLRKLWSCIQKGNYSRKMYQYLSNEIIANYPKSEALEFLRKNRDISEYLSVHSERKTIDEIMSCITQETLYRKKAQRNS